MEIFNKLKDKFLQNYNSSISIENDLLREAEFKANLIYSLGAELKRNYPEATKQSITCILDEIFSDLIVSMHLSLCSLDNASRVLLRRALELGIAVVYFWDMPHKYWSWKNIDAHESDLSFKDNLEFLGGTAYNEYLKNEFSIYNWSVDKTKINAVYRKLSNIIHGKYQTFETSNTNSYDFDAKDFKDNLKLTIKCCNVLINILQHRFPTEFLTLTAKLPAKERYTYEY